MFQDTNAAHDILKFLQFKTILDIRTTINIA